MHPFEPWRVQNGVATRGLTLSTAPPTHVWHSSQLIFQNSNCTVGTATLSNCPSGDVLKERVHRAWLAARHKAPAIATQYDPKALLATYNVHGTEDWAAGSIKWHKLDGEDGLHLHLLASPPNETTSPTPTTLHINERGNGQLDIALFGPHTVLDGRVTRCLLNLISGWVKHGDAPTLVEGEEISRLPLDVEYIVAGERANEKATQEMLDWIQTHPLFSWPDASMVATAPLSGKKLDAVEVLHETLSEAESSALLQAVKKAGWTMGPFGDALGALVLSQLSREYTPSHQFDIALVASNADLAARMRPGFVATMCTNVTGFTTWVPEALMKPATAALEQGQVPPELNEIVAFIKANYDIHLSPGSLAYSTRNLQRWDFLSRVKAAGGFEALVQTSPCLFVATNVGGIETNLARLGQHEVHFDSVIASAHLRAPVLIFGTSTLRGRMKFVLQSQKDAYVPGFTQAFLERYLSYLRVFVEAAHGHRRAL